MPLDYCISSIDSIMPYDEETAKWMIDNNLLATYLLNVVKKRMPEHEHLILSSVGQIYEAIQYANAFIPQRWPELEKKLLEQEHGAIALTNMVSYVSERNFEWPEADTYIANTTDLSDNYKYSAIAYYYRIRSKYNSRVHDLFRNTIYESRYVDLFDASKIADRYNESIYNY